jgi:hypothetical protein
MIPLGMVINSSLSSQSFQTLYGLISSSGFLRVSSSSTLIPLKNPTTVPA